MDYKAFTATLILLVCGCSTQDKVPERSLIDIADEAQSIYLNYYPSKGGRIPDTEHFYGRLRDNSIEGYEKWYSNLARIKTELLLINTEQLLPKEKALFDVLYHYLNARDAYTVCQNHLWDVSPFGSWNNIITRMLDKQPVSNKLEENYALNRYANLIASATNEIDNLERGLLQGYSSPSNSVNAVLKQLDRLLETKKNESSFYKPYYNSSNDVFKAQWNNLVKEQIVPAFEKYRDYLKNKYVKKARQTIGLYDMPKGAACYQANLFSATSLNVSPEQVELLGKEPGMAYEKALFDGFKRVYDVDTLYDYYRFKPQSHFPFKTMSNWTN